jgi:hypothetical protein
MGTRCTLPPVGWLVAAQCRALLANLPCAAPPQALGNNRAVQQLVLALQTEQASLPERKLAPLREAVSQGLQVGPCC